MIDWTIIQLASNNFLTINSNQHTHIHINTQYSNVDERGKRYRCLRKHDDGGGKSSRFESPLHYTSTLPLPLLLSFIACPVPVLPLSLTSLDCCCDDVSIDFHHPSSRSHLVSSRACSAPASPPLFDSLESSTTPARLVSPSFLHYDIGHSVCCWLDRGFSLTSAFQSLVAHLLCTDRPASTQHAALLASSRRCPAPSILRPQWVTATP